MPNTLLHFIFIQILVSFFCLVKISGVPSIFLNPVSYRFRTELIVNFNNYIHQNES